MSADVLLTEPFTVPTKWWHALEDNGRTSFCPNCATAVIEP